LRACHIVSIIFGGATRCRSSSCPSRPGAIPCAGSRQQLVGGGMTLGLVAAGQPHDMW
jgi:hypothetical protein